MPLDIRHTSRGFPFVEFLDYDREMLRLQLSSLADMECVWLNDSHLSRAQVATLLPYLTAFVEHGCGFFELPIGEHPMLAELRKHEEDLRGF